MKTRRQVLERIETLRNELKDKGLDKEPYVFKDGELVLMLERRLIESADATGIAEILIKAFDKYCSAPGPSISAEIFRSNFAPPRCSSALPRLEE